MVTLNGQCLCGKITYTYHGPTGKIVHCHCSKCRKWHGAAFRSRMAIKRDGFRWVSGETLLSLYDSSKNVSKSFCKHCGSNLLSVYKHTDQILGLPIGGVEGNLDHIEQIHIFTTYKASWYDICDDNTQYLELPDDPGIIHRV